MELCLGFFLAGRMMSIMNPGHISTWSKAVVFRAFCYLLIGMHANILFGVMLNDLQIQ